MSQLNLSSSVVLVHLPVTVLSSGILTWPIPVTLLNALTLDVLEALFLGSPLGLALDVLIEVSHKIGSLLLDISLPTIDGEFVGLDLVALLEVLLMLSRLLDLLGMLLQLLLLVVSDLNLSLNQTASNLGHHPVVLEHISQVVLRSVKLKSLICDLLEPSLDVTQGNVVELDLSLDVIVDINSGLEVDVCVRHND